MKKSEASSWDSCIEMRPEFNRTAFAPLDRGLEKADQLFKSACWIAKQNFWNLNLKHLGGAWGYVQRAVLLTQWWSSCVQGTPARLSKKIGKCTSGIELPFYKGRKSDSQYLQVLQKDLLASKLFVCSKFKATKNELIPKNFFFIFFL